MDERWIFELGLRFYTQDAADFYSDLFPLRGRPELPGARQGAQHLLEPDAEPRRDLRAVARLEVPQALDLNLRYDRMQFEYDDFRDLTTGGAPGAEPLYEFDANVFRFFFSGWF